MKYFVKITLIFLAIFGIDYANAAPTEATKAEITKLMAVLSNSNCEFQRNGSWYDGKKATEHLQRKYDYLLKRGLSDTTELFIERAGSKSSFSGDAYQVRCPGKTVQNSAPWFTEQLTKIRSGK